MLTEGFWGVLFWLLAFSATVYLIAAGIVYLIGKENEHRMARRMWLNQLEDTGNKDYE